MALDLFDKPIYAQSRHFIQELMGLDDAFDYLEEWPQDQRNLAFEAVVRSLREAACYRRPISLAEEDFRRFLKRFGKLAAIEDLPAYRTRDRSHNIGGL